ncbi:lysozyme inhibitor LprI family protein [Capilliphycus salinus ALCB114379]|uniref:lysozyme inhibitor LprI family protein n=1 Tax=Capilliphycus salinus TaxID=2768948 RepID=UPI0039A6CC0B
MLKTLTTVSLSLMIALSGFSIVMSSSLAEPSLTMAQTVQCREDGSMIEMRKCAQDKYVKVDKELNQTYQKLMANLNDNQRKQRLISAQRSWIQFRDKTCSYEASEALGGSLEGLLLTNCLTRVTAHRTSELKQYLSALSQR